MKLQSLKDRIYDKQKNIVIEQLNNNVSIENSIFTDKEIEDFKEENDINNYFEYIEEDIDDVEQYEFNLNIHEEEDCGCESHETDDECQCPEYYLDFVPMEDGDEMDLHYGIEDRSAYHDGIKTYLAMKDALFAEDYEVYENIDFDEKGNEIITEGAAQVIFKRTKGKIIKKKKCGPGMRLAGRRCLPQTGTQKASMKKLGITLKRAKKAMGSAAKRKAARIAKITKKRIKGRNRSLASLAN
tara:strand:+ start:9954 stop:10679 length:726 start_codon:yes stop_codon:yes gene_type:complete